MGTFQRRRRRALGAAVVFCAAGLGNLPGASAELGVHPPWATGGEVIGPAPAEAFADFADCPGFEAYPEGLAPEWCLVATIYDGEIKLGSTVAEVAGPIKLVVGVAIGQDPVTGDPTGFIVPAPGGGGPAPVAIEGGLLGMPELDPLIDSLGGLLSVSATPLMGDVSVPAADAIDFLGWLDGDDNDVTLSLPLSIQLDNLLLGRKCSIPEFTLNLTTGTTTVPEGVEPMVGSNGDFVNTTFFPVGKNSFSGHKYELKSRVGAELVDNGFSVPGASKCDLLFGDLLDQPTGLFDSVVNDQTALPSGPGQNYARFHADVAFAAYRNFLVGATGTPNSPLAFGNVTVGQVSPVQTVTLTSDGNLPFILGPLSRPGNALTQYQIVDDLCSGVVLAPGQTCTVGIRFAPTSAGTKNGSIGFPDARLAATAARFAPGASSLAVSGRGVAP